jgi:hypothetical protein
MLILADPENLYAAPQDIARIQRNLVARACRKLPTEVRGDLLDDASRIVVIRTWGSYPFEFAHFTDNELASIMLANCKKPNPGGRPALVSALHAERTRTARGSRRRVARVGHYRVPIRPRSSGRAMGSVPSCSSPKTACGQLSPESSSAPPGQEIQEFHSCVRFDWLVSLRSSRDEVSLVCERARHSGVVHVQLTS